ncbi:MAG: MoxR family ATPase [Clostridiales bacterium]|jgi:MoxR-like ATPase|nr:MoxR family ATPase [Clostridiales bacterium]
MAEVNGEKTLNDIIENIEKVIVGKRQAVELALISLLSKGHILIEDMPGVGKTSLAASLAKSVDCSFKRIQFTPDIMPSDITGFSMYNQKSGEFEYISGAVMGQFVLADEINRTSPKTQSSLLEVMEENRVTIDGKVYEVPKPFIVMATQNPIEYLGTYPLPEAQLDRFFMKISIGYPPETDELTILSRFNNSSPLDTLRPVANDKDILAIQDKVSDVHVDITVSRYIIELVRKTRENPYLVLGGSPRATMCLYRASQARALLKGRDFVTPDDVLVLTGNILGHRLILSQEARLKKMTAGRIIQDILNNTKVPVI